MLLHEIQTYGNIYKGESKISAWDGIQVKMILEPLEALGFAVYHTENPQQGLHGYLFRDTLYKGWLIKNDSSSDVAVGSLSYRKTVHIIIRSEIKLKFNPLKLFL